MRKILVCLGFLMGFVVTDETLGAVIDIGVGNVTSVKVIKATVQPSANHDTLYINTKLHGTFEIHRGYVGDLSFEFCLKAALLAMNSSSLRLIINAPRDEWPDHCDLRVK